MTQGTSLIESTWNRKLWVLCQECQKWIRHFEKNLDKREKRRNLIQKICVGRLIFSLVRIFGVTCILVGEGLFAFKKSLNLVLY